jgi:hypothetical protein
MCSGGRCLFATGRNNPTISQNLFDRLGFIVYNPSESIHYDIALIHMRKDAPYLPLNIQSFFTEAESAHFRRHQDRIMLDIMQIVRVGDICLENLAVHWYSAIELEETNPK